MREVIIIEKDEVIGLSVLIAERIIADSENFYGFRMVPRDSKNEMGRDGMLRTLVPSIRKALQGRVK